MIITKAEFLEEPEHFFELMNTITDKIIILDIDNDKKYELTVSKEERN